MKTKNIDNLLNEEIRSGKTRKELSAAGWYRIARCDELETGGFGHVVQISLVRVYGSYENEAYLISLCLSYNNQVFKTLNSSVKIQLFTKIRYVTFDGKAYIEVYYGSNTANHGLVGIEDQTKPGSKPFTVLPFEKADDTATVLVEQEILNDEVKINSYTANTNDEAAQILDHLSDKMPARTKYEYYISISYEGGRYLSGGIWHIEGAKATENFEYQIARRYAATGVLEMRRSKFNGTWGNYI